MNDIDFMTIALEEAKKAAKNNEIPVGAVIVLNGKILSKAHNNKEKTHDITGHAEILALKKASKILNSWNLSGATIYVTMEPCLMCSSAIINSRIKRIVYGVDAIQNELSLSLISDYIFNNGIEVKKSLLKNEINEVLEGFFNKIRCKK